MKMLSILNEINPSQSAEFLARQVSLLFLLVTVLSRLVRYPVHSLGVVMDSSMSLYTSAFLSALTIVRGNNSALKQLICFLSMGWAGSKLGKEWCFFDPTHTIDLQSIANQALGKIYLYWSKRTNILVYCFFMRLRGDPKAEYVLYFQTHCENAGCIHFITCNKQSLFKTVPTFLIAFPTKCAEQCFSLLYISSRSKAYSNETN